MADSTTTPTTTAPSSGPAAAERTCVYCQTHEADLSGETLKRCGRCRAAWYCSKECQKADYQKHKKGCAKQGQSQQSTGSNVNANSNPNSQTTRSGSGSSSNSGTRHLPFNPFQPNMMATYFSQPEFAGGPNHHTKAYQQLIDVFRLRVEDDYVWGGHLHGVYGKSDPMPDFVDFLARAKAKQVLPAWWDDAAQRECLALAGASGGAYNIKLAVEKSDIQEDYADPMKPMTFRMIAETVYGGGYGMGQMPMPQGYVCRCPSEEEVAAYHSRGMN